MKESFLLQILRRIMYTQGKKVTLKSPTEKIVVKHKEFLNKIDRLTEKLCKDFEHSIKQWNDEPDLLIKTVNYEKANSN